MNVLYLAVFLALAMGPIIVVWRKGDQILDHLSARRRARRMLRRQRSTRALPVREDALEALVRSEEKRDEIDHRISKDLTALRQASTTWRDSAAAYEASGGVVDDMERILLKRESHFNTYLDIAWLQSETIELLTREVVTLREIAGVRDLESSKGPPSRMRGAERLFENLKAAERRQAEADRHLDQIGSAGTGIEPRSDSGSTREWRG
jgi:hypothetical protein